MSFGPSPLEDQQAIVSRPTDKPFVPELEKAFPVTYLESAPVALFLIPDFLLCL
jgi:hypothetical protein